MTTPTRTTDAKGLMMDDVMKEADHVLLKRGLYYRPNANGYTGLKCEAGLYPRSYALGLDGVVAVPVADAPEFSPACWEQTKVAHLTAALTAASAEAEAIEAELGERVQELAAAHAIIHQLGENAAKAAREYAEEVDALRQRIGNLEGMLGQALPYVTKCADMDLADAVACMMLIEHELRNTARATLQGGAE